MNRTHLQPEAKHKEILKYFTFNEYKRKVYKSVTFERSRSKIEEDTINILQSKNEKFSDSGVTIYPEFLEYIFLLEGCSKKLLLYLIFHHIDVKTCEFIFNDQIINDFTSYNNIVTNGIKTNSKGSVKSAMRKLVEFNIILNVKKGTYMINPMIVGGSIISSRRLLIQRYSLLLINKNKNGVKQFFPI